MKEIGSRREKLLKVSELQHYKNMLWKEYNNVVFVSVYLYII